MPTPKINLLPSKLDLALYAGDGAAVRLTVTDNAGLAVPLLPGEVTAQIRQTRLSVESLADFNTDFSGDDLNILTLTLNGEQTAALITDEEIFKGVWDVQWVKENQEPITLAQGKVEVDADVTR